MKYQSGIAAVIMGIVIYSGFIFIQWTFRPYNLPVFGFLVFTTGFGCGLITQKTTVMNKATLLFLIFGLVIMGGILILSQSLSGTTPAREPDPEEEGPPRGWMPLISPRGVAVLGAILIGIITVLITPVVWISGLLGVKASHYLFKKNGSVLNSIKPDEGA